MALGGGKNKWPAFLVKDSGTAYAIRNADDTAVAALPADSVINFTQIEEAKLSPQADGTLKGVITQYDDSAEFDAFLDEYASVSAGTAGLPEVKFIDGAKIGGTASSGGYILMIAYGPKNPADSKRKMRVGVYTVATTSGDEDYKDGSYLKPSLEINSIKLAYDLVIPKELFDSSFVTVSADVTISAGKGFKRMNVTAP